MAAATAKAGFSNRKLACLLPIDFLAGLTHSRTGGCAGVVVGLFVVPKPTDAVVEGVVCFALLTFFA